MTLNFPDTPGNGEKYLAENGIEYTYNLANDTWTGALSAQNVPINPSPSDVSVDPPFGNPSGTNPGSGTLADPFIITDSIVPTLNGSTQSLQTITITSGKAGDQVVFTNNTTPLDISSKYTQPLGYIDANGKWIGKLVYNDSFGADTTSNTTYTGKLQCGTGTVYFQWNVQQQATPAMFVTAGTALTGTPVSGTDLGATQPTVTGGLSPYTYSYKWQTSNDNIAFTDIPSAITSSYSLTSTNVGKYIRCIATVSDSSTIQAVTVSSTTATVNVVSIDVSLSTQNPQANQPIQASVVVLGGVAPVTTAYQWKADGVNIIGATSATYVVEVATNGKRLSCQITTTDAANTNAVKTSTQTNPVASGDVPEINTVTLAEVTPDTPDRFTDQSFTVAVDMTKDNPKSDYAIRGKVLGDLTVDATTSVITKLEEEAVSGDWNGVAAAADRKWASVTYGNGKFVAVSQAVNPRDLATMVMYSSDGLSWTSASGAGNILYEAVIYGGDKFVAVGGLLDGDIYGMYSSDGISWTGFSMPSSNSQYALAYGGGKFVAVGGGNVGASNVALSSDGINWAAPQQAQLVGLNQTWNGIAYGGGKFVAVAANGSQRVMYSTDGEEWTLADAATGEDTYWMSVTYADGKFVATGSQGSERIMYSTDGINWTGVTAPQQSNWQSVTHGGGKFVAVTGDGPSQVMYSTDATSWSLTTSAEANQWQSITYGDGKFVAVANDGSNRVMWSYTGTGIDSTSAVLTLTDTTGLSSINTGDVVVQNSGGTPVTTAITNVTNTPINKTQAYVFTGTPSNLDDVLANGTLVTTGNTWNSSQCLVLVNNAGNTIPDMTSVFSANGDTSFYVGLGESYGNPTNGGSFKADGTRLGGSGGYNNTEWILMKYSDIANEGNYDSSYRIYDDAEVAYTVIGYYNANSNITFGTIADVGTVSRPTLTLTDDTNLANFRVGDVLQSDIVGAYLTGNDWPQGASNIYSNMTWADFTADQSTYYGPVNGYAAFFGANNPFIFPYYASKDTEVYFWFGINSGKVENCVLSGDVNNPGAQQVTGNTSGSPSQVFIQLKKGYGTFTINSMQQGDTSADQSSGAFYCYGRSEFTENTNSGIYQVTGINEATPSITTNGGSWSGTDGTGDEAWNKSKVWSDGLTAPNGTFYNNEILSFNGNTTSWTTTLDSDTLKFAPAEPVVVNTSFGYYVPDSPYVTGISVTLDGAGGYIDVSSSPIGKRSFPEFVGKTISSSTPLIVQTINSTRTECNFGSLEIDNKLLVDTGVPGGPETSVTGPTQAAASGTVKLAGAREVTAAIQTSTITNVSSPVAIDPNLQAYCNLSYSNSGLWADGNRYAYNMFDGNIGTYASPADGQTCTLDFTSAGGLYIGGVLGIGYAGAATVSTLVINGTDVTAEYNTGSNPANNSLATISSLGNLQYINTMTFNRVNSSDAIQISRLAVDGVYRNFNTYIPDTTLTLTDTTDLALFAPGDIVQYDQNATIGVTASTSASPNVDQFVAAWPGAGPWIPIGVNSTGDYVEFNSPTGTLVLKGSRYDEIDVNITATGDFTGGTRTFTWASGGLGNETFVFTSPGKVRFTVNNNSNGITFNNTTCTINSQTFTIGVTSPVTVVSTNLSTPSISTNGGAWTGSDGTSSGEVANRETKVTGPLKTTEVAGPYLTLSPSSGRWLVTETGYSTPLKLNKFAKSSSVQSVASLFTVMDGLGNVTDLTTEDPGYTNMVGDPTYTLTFPSVFPSGQTPDVELPAGTKYQVEVKATNDIGVDNAFSNDVMPIAGLLQTSVITNAAIRGKVQNLVTGGTWKLLDGTATNLAGGNPMVSWPVVFDSDPASYAYFSYGAVSSLVSTYRYTFAEPIPFTTLKAYVGSYSANPTYWISFNGGTPLRGSVNYIVQLVDYTNAVNGDTELRTLEIGTDGPNYCSIGGIEIDGVLLTEEYDSSITTLTTVDTTNYNLFSAGDEVVESSGGTPVTSAITNVNDAQLPAQDFSVCDRSSDTMSPYSGNYGQLFDGASGTSSTGPSWSNGNSGTATLFDLSSSIPLTSLEFQMTGAADFGIKITDGVGVVHTITPFSGPGGGAYTSVPVSDISSIKKVQVDGYGNAFGMYSIKLNGSLMVDNVALAYGTLLTFNNDTNLANFRIGDQLNGGSGFVPVIYTGTSALHPISCGFSPDLVWIKSRNNSYDHHLADTVRGNESSLSSNTTTANQFNYSGVMSFDPDGFTLGTGGEYNETTSTFVAWCWNAGDTTVTNNEGTIESQVRSNGNFSIVSYTGNGLTDQSVGIGLNTAPKMIIVKELVLNGVDWVVWNESLGPTGYLRLNSTAASSADANRFSQAPSSSLMYIGNDFEVNANSTTTPEYIAYCWSESPTQNFGSYTGNGSSAAGPVIDCGFEPALVMMKRTDDANNWCVIDSARGASVDLKWNTSEAETSGDPTYLEFLPNGFKLISSNQMVNAGGGTYIYAAFAGGTTVTGINEAANQMTVEGGLFSPLVNSSRQWSDGVSSNNGGFGSSEQPEMGFDGLPDTKCKCQQNNAIITIAFSPAITVNKSLKLRYAGSGYGSGYIQIEANGTEVVDTPASGKAGTIIDIPFTGSLTSISIQEGSQNAGFSQIFVDGDVLMNGPWNTSKNWAASSGLNTSNRGPITLAFNGSIGDSVSEGINDSDTVVIGTNITINTSLQYWSHNTSGQSTTWRFKRASDGNIAVTTLNNADKNNYDYNTVPLPTESGHGLGVEYSQISAQRSTSSETISAIRLDGQVLVDPTTISVTEVTGPTFPPATGTISSTGTRITDKVIQTSTITNVGTAPWPLWNNTALNWSVTGTKTSYNNGGDVVTSALPIGSLLYTEFTIVGTSVQKQLGVQFTTTPNSAYDNNIVGWYFNGASGSKAVWLAGGDSNSSMGAGMGGTGQALFTRADHDAGVSSGSSYGSGDVLGYAIDPDGNVWVSKNGVYLATDDWYNAGNGEPVPGLSGYVSTINSDTRYFGAQYNGGQTFLISATGTYTPLQTSLTLTDDTDLAFFSYGDVVQGNNTPEYSKPTNLENASYGTNAGKGWPEILNQTMGSTWNTGGGQYWCYSTGGSSITFQYTDSNLISLYVTSSGGAGNTITITGDVSETSATISNNSNAGGVCEPTVLTPTKTSGTFTITQGASTYYWFNVGGNLVNVLSTNLSTPSITTTGGSWTGSDGTSSGFVDERETKVTGPVKAITQSGPYITFSETTGRWLVTQSDYDTAKKLDTTVRVPLVLDASNTAHVALFNAMNTKFTAFPTARQTFIDALRTKIIGLTLTTPELEVLCGTAKTLVKRHEITIVDNKFYIDGVLQATLSLKKGTTYIFDQDEATNSGHTLKLYTDANKTTEYTSGVTVIGTPGGATSRTTFVVPSNAPAVLYYQSTAAASMGGQLNIS